jgi:hypothetical protein
MRIVLSTLVLVFALTTAAQARLGETPDQLVARYGQPLKEDDQKAEGTKIQLANVKFQKNGFEIDVTITDGVSSEEIFRKLNGQPITVNEARVLMAANAQDRDWNAPHRSADGITWTRDDNATGFLPADGSSFTVRSHALVDEEISAKRLEQHPSLDGF